jgi:hypothetical protein
MIPQIAGLTKQGISDYLDNMKYQLSVQALWNDLAKSDHGKFLVHQLEKDQKFWRAQYSQIDSASPAAPNLLSFIQGVELILSSLISSVTEGGTQASEIQKEIEDIGEFLKLKQNQRVGLTMLPSGYVKKEKSK